jgi:NAD(P)-dependent dehydrogenase (short-subunit alcohol dehydrogenase family)
METKGNIRTFKDATVIITGGASGIGRGLAEELALLGADVVIADLQDDLAQEVVSGIKEKGGSAQAVHLDVADLSAFKDLAEETVQRTGRIDYLFNNAGIGTGGEVKDLTIEYWDRAIDVNLRGVINGIQAVYTIMISQGFGHIINTSSIAGLMPSTIAAPYTATKFAVTGLTIALRMEAAMHGVRVSVLCPGVVRTPIFTGGKYGMMTEGMNKDALLKMWEKGRPMHPNTFAKKVLKKVARNKPYIIIPWWWKLIWFIYKMFPRFSIFMGTIMFKRTLKELSKKEGADQ